MKCSKAAFGEQNKKCFYSGSGNLHAVGGVKGLRCKGWVISLRIEIECKDTAKLHFLLSISDNCYFLFAIMSRTLFSLK